jgi:hypothetical protein
MATVAPSAAGASTPARRRVPVALRILIVPFAFAVFIKIVGSFIFSFSTGTLEGYVWGASLVAAGLLYLFLMFRLPRGEAVMWRTAVGLVAADIAWNIYKVFIYGESESTVIFAGTLVSMGLLWLPSVRRFFHPPA